MRASSSNRRCRQSIPLWHKLFLAILPAIQNHARIAFRDLKPEARAEAVQEVVANALVAFVRLVQLGKTDIVYGSALARFGVAQVRDGRRVGTPLNVRDVTSPYAQKMKGITVARLDKYDRTEEVWEEILVADGRATPAELAASRIDFPAWLATLSRRNRKIALKLAAGEKTSRVARLFRISEGRISQLRRELKAAWQAFHGETEPPPAAAVPV